MKKILISLMALALVGCTSQPQQEENLEKKSTSKESSQEAIKKDTEEKETKEEETPEKSVKNEGSAEETELFKELAGKEFIGNMNGGSERLYFFEDGSFDSGGLFGNGNLSSLYIGSGKFELVEKIDESTYNLKLADFAYESPVDTEEEVEVGGQKFIQIGIRSALIDEKNIGETYRIHLPSTRLDSFSEDVQEMIGYQNDYIKDGKTNIFMISQEKKGFNGMDRFPILSEVIKDEVKMAKENDNYFRDMAYGWKDAFESHEEKAPSQGNFAYDYDDSHLDYSELSDIYLASYKASKEGAISYIDLDKGLGFIKENPETFVYPKYALDFIDKFNEAKSISKIKLDPKADQDFIKIYGDFIEERDIAPEGSEFGVWNNLLSASLNSGEKILIDIDYCGDFRNCLWPTDYGTKQARVWALPLGVYTINKDGQEIRVFKFASGQGIMNAAYMHFGESYGF